jgi:hypothetical protein
MHALPIMIVVLCALAISYRYYSAFLAAKVAVLDDSSITPAHDVFLDGFERRKMGIPDNSGWPMPFADAVARFLKDAPTSDERRRK